MGVHVVILQTLQDPTLHYTTLYTFTLQGYLHWVTLAVWRALCFVRCMLLYGTTIYSVYSPRCTLPVLSSIYSILENRQSVSTTVPYDYLRPSITITSTQSRPLPVRYVPSFPPLPRPASHITHHDEADAVQ